MTRPQSLRGLPMVKRKERRGVEKSWFTSLTESYVERTLNIPTCWTESFPYKCT